MGTVRWVVGAEHDKEAIARLGEALRSLSYDLQGQWQGVAGSQDVAHWEVLGPSAALTVDAETYVGLSVDGPAEAVDQLKRLYEQMPSNPSFQRTASQPLN